MLRRFFTMAALAAGALLLVAGGAWAQQKKAKWPGGPVHVTAAIKGGAFFPDEGNLKMLYDHPTWAISTRIGFMVEHNAIGVDGSWAIPGTLGVNLEGGISRFTGIDYLPPFPKLSLLIVPVTLGGEYAFRFSQAQLVVPYIGAGGAAAYFRDEARSFPVQLTDGARYGWFAEAGLRLRLNQFDPHAARSAFQSLHIRDSYLDLRARKQSIKGFDAGIDLSGYVFDGGLSFDF